MEDLQGVVDTIRAGVEEIGARFEDPEADWQPVFFALSEQQFVPMVFEGSDFTEEAKDAFSWAATELMRVMQAEVAVFVASIWMVVLEKEAGLAATDQAKAFEAEHGRKPRTYEEAGAIAPRDDPRRVEAVLMHVIEPEQVSMSWAEIHRSTDAPPALGEWQHLAFADSSVEGRFTTPVQEQLRRNVENG